MMNQLTPEGRPRDASISRALIQVAERRMEADGFSKLTVEGVVSDAGTTRQTFYRRYPSVAHLALDVICARFGEVNLVDTKSLESDLLELQRDDLVMMNSALLKKNLSGLLEVIRSDREVRALFAERLFRPRRANVKRVIDLAVLRGELDGPDIDSEYICDLLVGALLARTVIPTGAPLDDRFARQTVETALSELRGYR